MTVYVIQESEGRNFFAARRYGELVALMPANAQIVLSADPAVSRMSRTLKNYGDQDYLLMTGDPAMMGIAVAIAALNNRGKVRLLKWDKFAKDYYPVEVDIYQKGESSE